MTSYYHLSSSVGKQTHHRVSGRLLSPQRSWRIALTRCLVLCLLSAVVFAQVSAGIHELTVRHAICPRDGELIDVDESSQPFSPVDAVASGRAEITAYACDQNEGNHHHCAFISSRNTRKFFKVNAPSQAPLPELQRRTSVSEDERAAFSNPIYLTAPKHSPPSA
jgi:hypothetical protein